MKNEIYISTSATKWTSDLEIRSWPAACGTSAGSQSQGRGQEPELPVCHRRQNTQQHVNLSPKTRNTADSV